jgi:RNA polymerase sigma-70 factor, ECF subfamily
VTADSFSASAARVCVSGNKKIFNSNYKNSKFHKMEGHPNKSANVSQMVGRWPESDREAASRLLLLVNEELRARASTYWRREHPGQSLQASALIQQASLKLAIEDGLTSKNRAHFCAVAANLMRRILMEQARDHNSQKCNGRGRKISLQQPCGIHQEGGADLIALDEALERFGLAYPRASAVVEMKFFGGMDTKEIAEVLSVPEKTVLSDWSFAKLWLSRVLMQRTRNQGERVARLFRSISECNEKELGRFVRIPRRS